MEGGAEIALCDAAASYTGADWGEDGNIIASLRVSGGLSRVSSAGGTPTPVTELEGEERTHRWPQILPGGKAILFTAENSTVGFDDANKAILTPSGVTGRGAPSSTPCSHSLNPWPPGVLPSSTICRASGRKKAW